MFKNKVVIVTGGAKGIGLEIVKQFRDAGANVCVIDLLPNDYFQGDIGEAAVIEQFIGKVIKDYGKVDYLINNALPPMEGLEEADFDSFQRALAVGVTAPFYLSKLLLPHWNQAAAIVNITSTRDSMSQANTETYSAAKGALRALTHSLAISLAGKVRVNAISPGWIETSGAEFDPKGSDALQHPVQRVGQPADIANMVLFLCSDKASFITGETIRIDGGMSRQMIYHGDQGWGFHPA